MYQRPILYQFASSESLPLQREVQYVDVEDYYVSDSSERLVVTVDLKDAHFHIQVVQRHRKFLRFAFGGKTCQYKVLPFGLALAPMTFKKCMDAALAPLRLQDICVLNYLDDWLILAHSRESVSCHRDVVHQEECSLPFQQILFLGVNLDSVQMQARLAPAQISSLNTCLAHFKLDHHFSVSTCHRLLGLMATASPVLPLGLLHMRPFLWVDEGFMVPLHRTSDSLLCFRTLLI